MAKITITIDLDNVDASLEDPWEIADELLDEQFPPFTADEHFSFNSLSTGQPRSGNFVSAEWSE